MKMSRHPKIIADAALEIFKMKSQTATGNFFIDEEVLDSIGISDFSVYDMVPGAEIVSDLFLD